MKSKIQLLVSVVASFALLLTAAAAQAADKPAASDKSGAALESRHLGNIQRVTFGLPRAGEGYFSPDGKWVVYQAYPVGYPFYQIYVQKLGEKTTRRVSTGRGRTTCSYFTIDGKRILFASSHTDPQIAQTERQARDLAAQGGRRRYQWDFDKHMDIYVCDFNGTGLKRLTNSPGYDAEGSYSADGKHIVFTSGRDGDPDLYIMDADGKNVRQLVNNPGYDGGPFFSPDGKWVIYRSDRQKEHMLQIFAIRVDGKHDTQLTNNLGTVNWAPYFHPSGGYIIWTRADYSKGPRGAHFNLFTLDLQLGKKKITVGDVRQVTSNVAADVLPVFSPDGKKLMWTSARSKDKTSQLWIADWKRSVEAASR